MNQNLRTFGLGGVLAMLLTGFVSMPASSYNPGGVLKTINVADANDAAYAGARVALVFTDIATGYLSSSAVATTNVSGVASLTVPGDLVYAGIAVAPRSDDLVSAVRFLSVDASEVEINPWSESFDVTLGEANFFIRPLSPNGSEAPAGTGASLWTMNSFTQFVFPGTGTFGIDVPDDFESEDKSAYLQLNPLRDGLYSNYLDFTTLNGGLSFDATQNGDEYLPVSTNPAIYELRFKAPNVSVELRSSASGALALPAGVVGKVRFIYASDSDFSKPDLWSAMNRDGGAPFSVSLGRSLAAGLIDVLPLGSERYPLIPQVFLTGSEAYPSFLAPTVWVDSEGKFHDSANSSTPIDTLQISIPTQSPNLVLQNFRKGTSIQDAAYFEISAENPDPGVWWGNNLSTNGVAAYLITEFGQYRLNVAPVSSSRPSADYDLQVSDQSVSLVHSSYSWDQLGPQQLVNLATDPFGSFTVSGRVNDDIRVFAQDPVTQKLLPASAIDVNISYNLDANSGTGVGFGSPSSGPVSVDFPEPGSYFDSLPITLSVEPRNSAQGLDPLLARKEYQVSWSGTAWVVRDGARVITSLSDLDDIAYYALPMGYANVFGNLQNNAGDPIGTDWEQNRWIQGQVQKYDSANNRWDFTSNGVQVRASGVFGVELPIGETYRIIFEPQGFDGVAATTTPSFSLSVESPDKFFENFRLKPSAFTLGLVVPGSTSPLPFASIYLSSNSAQISSWLWTGQNGKVNATVEAGEYSLEARADSGQLSGYANKTYRLVVSGTEQSGFSVAIYDGDTALVPIANSSPPSFLLELATPNLSGTLLEPVGSNIVRYTQVVPVDPQTGQEMWNLAAQVDSNGRWAMNLPTGTYNLFARAPWGNSTFGNSDVFEGIVVRSDGSIDLSTLPQGVTSASWTLRLNYPQWTGSIVDPISGQSVTDVQVCLFSQISGQCSQSDQSGNWALSKPVGFDDFDETYELMVRENSEPKYAESRFRGKSEIEGVLGSYVPGQRNSGRAIILQAPNVELRIMAGSSPARNAWVSLEGGNSWLGAASTDANGYVRFNVESPTQSLRVRVDVGHVDQLSQNFTGTTVELDFNSQNLASGVYSATLSLAVPNFRAVVKSPDGTTGLANSWVEAFDQTNNSWLGGSNTNESGFVNLNLPSASASVIYSLRVNPPWNASSNQYARNTFEVTVATNGVMSVVEDSAAVSNTAGRYVLKLANPSIKGKVVEPGVTASPVRDSWVTAYDARSREYLWQDGTNTNQLGNFAMDLADGVYYLTADVPWYLQGVYARSAQCRVDVTNNRANMTVVDSACQDSSGNLQIALKEPNFTLTLLTTVSGVAKPVQFANVGARVGDYQVNAQSDKNGKVSMFLDEAALKMGADRALFENWVSDASTSPGIQVPITFWFDPPWGSAEMVRWECSTGDLDELVCSDPALKSLTKNGTTWETWTAPGDLGSFFFKAPNTQITAYYPDGVTPLKEGAWINLFKERTEIWGTWKEWMGGSNTSKNGVASFNIEPADQSATFSLEINPPWNQRSEYPTRQINGLRLDLAKAPYFDFGTAGLALSSKNLSITVNQAKLVSSDPDKASRFSWIGIERYDTVSAQYTWLMGAGTSDKGKTALYLEPSANTLYRLSINPGAGAVGTGYTCYLEADSVNQKIVNAANNPQSASGIGGCGEPNPTGALTLALSLGNLRGTVTSTVSAVVEGAIVLAEATGVAAQAVTATTNAAGEFFMNLEEAAGRSWSIKVLYVNPSDLDPFLQRRKSAGVDGDSRDDVIGVTFSGGQALLSLGGTPLANNQVKLYRKLD
jgi:hypothetical protein